MFTGVILSVLAALLLVFFLLYKKQMISKMFALNVAAPANTFTQELEQTADLIIKRLEDEAGQLELLLDEAESKISMLSQQVEQASIIIGQLNQLEYKEVIAEPNRAGAPVSISHGLSLTLGQQERTKSLPAMDLADSGLVVKEPANLKKHRLIMTMADQGYNITEMAKVTGLGKGEIMLLLQLNKK